MAELRFPDGVKGWLTLEEGQQLYALAQDRVVLEIGSYHGRSTLCLAQSARMVYALDWHFGDAGTGFTWSLPTFVQTLASWNVLNQVVILAGHSDDVSVALGKQWCDLAFVDGAHDRQSVRHDVSLALRCLKQGGTLALHDWNYDSVKFVAGELGLYAPREVVGDLAWWVI